MTRPLMRAVVALLLVVFASHASTGPALSAEQPSDPAPPAGSPVKGTPVALLGHGADYTRPEIAAKLARDGEGEPIAWDFADNDARPYATTGQGTSDAMLLATRSRTALLVLVRQLPTDPNAVGHMIAFAMRTPARIVIWPDADPQRADWSLFLTAVERLPHLLFVIPSFAKLPQLPNLVAVRQSPAGAPRTTAASLIARQAAIAVAAEAADVLTQQPDLTSADLKAKLAQWTK